MSGALERIIKDRAKGRGVSPDDALVQAGIVPPNIKKLIGIAQAVQMLRMSLREVERSHANQMLDTAMRLAGYFCPDASLPIEHESHLAEKLHGWRDEIKVRDEKIRELELIIEKLSPFGNSEEIPELDEKGRKIRKPVRAEDV